MRCKEIKALCSPLFRPRCEIGKYLLAFDERKSRNRISVPLSGSRSKKSCKMVDSWSKSAVTLVIAACARVSVRAGSCEGELFLCLLAIEWLGASNLASMIGMKGKAAGSQSINALETLKADLQAIRVGDWCQIGKAGDGARKIRCSSPYVERIENVHRKHDDAYTDSRSLAHAVHRNPTMMASAG